LFPKNTNILVVDDSVNIRKMICETLQKLGFSKITTAMDANEAFVKMTQANKDGEPFTLVLSDLNMPGPTGLEFLKQIRSIPKYKDLPFLLVTTESEKGAVIEAAVHGVSSYVVKPFNIETLSKKLMEAWKKHHPE